MFVATKTRAVACIVSQGGGNASMLKQFNTKEHVNYHDQKKNAGAESYVQVYHAETELYYLRSRHTHKSCICLMLSSTLPAGVPRTLQGSTADCTCSRGRRYRSSLPRSSSRIALGMKPWTNLVIPFALSSSRLRAKGPELDGSTSSEPGELSISAVTVEVWDTVLGYCSLVSLCEVVTSVSEWPRPNCFLRNSNEP